VCVETSIACNMSFSGFEGFLSSEEEAAVFVRQSEEKTNTLCNSEAKKIR